MLHRKLLTIAFLLAVLLSPIAASGRFIILDYHTFMGIKSSLDYDLTDFGTQLDRLRAMGFRFVPLQDALADRIEGDANIVITIDDGNHSVWQAATEVLGPRGIPATLYIYPAVLGYHQLFLSKEQLVSLRDSGYEVGSHGYHHNYMTAKAYGRNPKDVLDEARRPGPALAALLGAAPATFAYPFGVACQQARDAVRDAGYSWAFTADSNFRLVDPRDPALDRFQVPRTIVYHWNKEDLFSFLARYAPKGG